MENLDLRKTLRGMKVGQSITLDCPTAYDFYSKRSNAYSLASMEGRRYECTRAHAGTDDWAIRIRRVA